MAQRPDKQKTPNELVNESGFPLQIAIQNLVDNMQENHRTARTGAAWKVLASEHSWQDKESGSAGFIDLVLEDENATSILVLECKRRFEKNWFFLSDRKDKETENDKVEMAKLLYSMDWGGVKFTSWDQRSVAPLSYAANFCIMEKTPNEPMLSMSAKLF